MKLSFRAERSNLADGENRDAIGARPAIVPTARRR
jgi:hypothetical protein